MAKKFLGWELKVSLKEGLARTYKWVEEQCRKGGKKRSVNDLQLLLLTRIFSNLAMLSPSKTIK